LETQVLIYNLKVSGQEVQVVGLELQVAQLELQLRHFLLVELAYLPIGHVETHN
jgi:hypothetical protein